MNRVLRGRRKNNILNSRQQNLFHFLQNKIKNGTLHFTNEEIMEYVGYSKTTFPTYQGKYLHSYIKVTNSFGNKNYRVNKEFKNVTEYEFYRLLKQTKKISK